MSITSLYRDYFQKSRVFLYPILEIKRGVSVTPVQTFTSWKGYHDHSDFKLSILYHLREDADFKMFEEVKLLGHPLFHDFKKVSESDGVYVFDLKDYKEDWEMFLKGKYSKLSKTTKQKIIAFHGTNTPNYPYIESFLHPEMYFQLYADLMLVDEWRLREVGELCSLPDHEQETLKISVKDLDIIQKSA